MRLASLRIAWLVASLLAPLSAAAVCQLPSCIQVADANLDGDLTAEFQQAVNDILYPGGALTSEVVVSFEAPPPGSYVLSDIVRLCYDATPPIEGGEDPGDCDGADTAGAFPTIRTTGNWSSATLRCILEDRPDQPRARGCLHIGDARNDATASSLGPLVSVDFSAAPLRLTIEESGIWDIFDPGPTLNGATMSTLLCDGCTGQVSGHFTIGGPGVVNAPLSLISASGLHLVGPNLTFTGLVDRDPAFYAATAITFDGDVQGSGLVGNVQADATIMVGSQRSGWSGDDDGCKWGAYDVPCRGWRLDAGAQLVSNGHDGGGIWFAEWEDVQIDGEVDAHMRADRLQPVKGHLYDVKAAINFGLGAAPFPLPAQGSVRFTGTCRNRGIISDCIRVFAGAGRDPAYPTTVLLDGLIERPDPLHHPLKPEMGSDQQVGGFVGTPFTDVTFGPTFHFVGANQAISPGNTGAHLVGPIAQPIHLVLADDDPGSLPRCASLTSGELLPCSNKATKGKFAFDSYLAVTSLRVDQDVPTDTSCMLRWRVAGDCVNCNRTSIQAQAPLMIHALDTAATDPTWSFANVAASNDPSQSTDGTGSLLLVTTASASGYAEWTPAQPLDLRRQYLLYDVWTDPEAVVDPQAFEHGHFSDTDGFHLRLTDASDRVREWHYGGAAGTHTDRLALGAWSSMNLRHWFEDAVIDDAAFDIQAVAKIRFEFNTVDPAPGRSFRLDRLRSLLREEDPFHYGIEFGPIRTRFAGDSDVRQIAGRVPANHIIQLEVAEPSVPSCVDGADCACRSIHATIDSGLIVVDDDGDRFNEIAQGFQPGGPGPCGLGFEGVLAAWALLARRRRGRA